MADRGLGGGGRAAAARAALTRASRMSRAGLRSLSRSMSMGLAAWSSSSSSESWNAAAGSSSTKARRARFRPLLPWPRERCEGDEPARRGWEEEEGLVGVRRTLVGLEEGISQSKARAGGGASGWANRRLTKGARGERAGEEEDIAVYRVKGGCRKERVETLIGDSATSQKKGSERENGGGGGGGGMVAGRVEERRASLDLRSKRVDVGGSGLPCQPGTQAAFLLCLAKEARNIFGLDALVVYYHRGRLEKNAFPPDDWRHPGFSTGSSYVVLRLSCNCISSFSPSPPPCSRATAPAPTLPSSHTRRLLPRLRLAESSTRSRVSPSPRQGSTARRSSACARCKAASGMITSPSVGEAGLDGSTREGPSGRPRSAR